jgi:alpha-D-ribose 1-methylphosphonate 5-triphosphate synthase subunit PhnH
VSNAVDGVMNAPLAEVGRGFARPAHDSQQVFRAVLEAMSRPGRVQTLAAGSPEGLDDAGLGRARAAVLLALLDAETSVWLHPALRREAALAQLRFHTGVRVAADASRAAFAVIDAAQADASLWDALEHGSDTVPQDGATLIVEVPSLQRGLALALRGPGVQTVQPLHVDGLDAAFWHARARLEREFPRGVDLVLTCGDRLAALPRSTRAALEG